MNKNKGYISAFAIILGIGLLITFSSVYQVLKVSTRHNNVIIEEDDALRYAETGLNWAINAIRNDPDLIPNTTFDDVSIEDPANPGTFSVLHDYKNNNGKIVGRFKSRAKRVNPIANIFENQVFYIETTAWSVKNHPMTSEPNETGVRIHSWVEMANIKNYVIAVKGDAIVGVPSVGDLDVREGQIYGRHIEFVPNPSTNQRIRVKEAHYLAGVLPVQNSSDYSAGKILITENAGRPLKVDAPPVFPIINEDYEYYKKFTPSYAQYTNVNFIGNQGMTNFITTPALGVGIDSAGTASNNLVHHYYLATGDVDIGNIEVRGQVIILAKGSITITGDIKSYSDKGKVTSGTGWTSDDETKANGSASGNPRSTAHQLYLIAPMIYIDNNWCNNNADKDLEIDAVLISPEGSLVMNSGGPCEDTLDEYSLKFNGALWMANQPTRIIKYFKKLREYKYMLTVKDDYGPLRGRANRLFEMEEFIARPDPSASPSP